MQTHEEYVKRVAPPERLSFIIFFLQRPGWLGAVACTRCSALQSLVLSPRGTTAVSSQEWMGQILEEWYVDLGVAYRLGFRVLAVIV
jgi:hypothetical protein